MRAWLATIVLAALLVSSAVGVVVSKHQSRALHAQLAELRWERDKLQIEWDQLQLEEATLAAHARVETQARSRLTMAEPEAPVTATLVVSGAHTRSGTQAAARQARSLQDGGAQ